MTWADLVIIAILALGLIHGWRAGFIVTFGNLVSLVVGLVATAWVFSWLSGTAGIGEWVLSHPIIAIIAFLVVYGIVVGLLRLAVKIINVAFKIVAIIPGVGLVNNLLGAIVGLAVGGVLVVLALFVVGTFGRSSGLIDMSGYPMLAERSSILPVAMDAAERLPHTWNLY